MGAEHSGNCARFKAGSMPAKWGFMVYTYKKNDGVRSISYWKEWLTHGEKWMSAGQHKSEYFQADIYGGHGERIMYINIVRPGDRIDVSYENKQWIVMRNGTLV